MLESHLGQTKPDSLKAVDPRNLYLPRVWSLCLHHAGAVQLTTEHQRSCSHLAGLCHLTHPAPPGGSRKGMAGREEEPMGEEGHLPGKCSLARDFLCPGRKQSSVLYGNHSANEMESRALETAGPTAQL